MSNTEEAQHRSYGHCVYYRMQNRSDKSRRTLGISKRALGGLRTQQVLDGRVLDDCMERGDDGGGRRRFCWPPGYCPPHEKGPALLNLRRNMMDLCQIGRRKPFLQDPVTLRAIKVFRFSSFYRMSRYCCSAKRTVSQRIFVGLPSPFRLILDQLSIRRKQF